MTSHARARLLPPAWLLLPVVAAAVHAQQPTPSAGAATKVVAGRVVGAALAIAATGGGRWSLDRRLHQRSPSA